MHDSLCPSHFMSKEGLGAENGLRGRELSQENRIARQQDIKTNMR